MTIQVQSMSPEQMIKMQKQKIVTSQKGFIRIVKKTIKEIEEMEPEDRMEYAHSLCMLINAMIASLKGWGGWCNINNMNTIKIEEFASLYPRLRKIAVEWLKIDVEITEQKTKEIEEELKEEEVGPERKTSPFVT